MGGCMKGVRIILMCLCAIATASFMVHVHGWSDGVNAQMTNPDWTICEARDREGDDGQGEDTEYC